MTKLQNKLAIGDFAIEMHYEIQNAELVINQANTCCGNVLISYPEKQHKDKIWVYGGGLIALDKFDT